MTEYDKAEVLDQTENVVGDYQQVLISTLPRTLQTLRYLGIETPYKATELLNEVSMGPFTDREKGYGINRLYVRGRTQWMFNSRRQPETRIQTVARAQEFIRTYLDQELNYLIIGHGHFLAVLSREMLKVGFKGEPMFRLNNGEWKTYQRTTI
jgi:broad specificity phosphatase PhoE